MTKHQIKTICRHEKKCKKCGRTIKVGEVHYRINRFHFICKDCCNISGECKQCGKCCRLTTYAGPYKFGESKKFDAFLALFGIDQEVYNKYYIYPDLKPGTIVYHKDVKCQHLTEDNRCKIYETRPIMCREFPNSIKDVEFAKKFNCGYVLKIKEVKP